MKIYHYIPPVFLRTLKKYFPSRTENWFPRSFLTFTEAQDACLGNGYEETYIVEAIFEKTRLVKDQMLSGKIPLSDATTQSLLAVLLSLQAAKNQKQLKVIDFGGACGAHYFQLRPFLSHNVQLDWVVVETPAMVAHARKLENNELRFCNSLDQAQEQFKYVDLLHSSGALQYVPDPKRTMQEFISCQPAYIFLNRLVMSSGDTFIAIQESLLSANGPGTLPDSFVDRLCRYPVTYFSISQFDEIFARNYHIKFRFSETQMLTGKKKLISNVGLFLERIK